MRNRPNTPDQTPYQGRKRREQMDATHRPMEYKVTDDFADPYGMERPIRRTSINLDPRLVANWGITEGEAKQSIKESLRGEK